jgi:transcriptional regulator with XRE-family HTH domain
MKPNIIDNCIGLGRRIRAAREALGLTQMDAAARCKIHPVQYPFYEQGRREPNIANLRKLCQGLGVSADYLIFGK